MHTINLYPYDEHVIYLFPLAIYHTINQFPTSGVWALWTCFMWLLNNCRSYIRLHKSKWVVCWTVGSAGNCLLYHWRDHHRKRNSCTAQPWNRRAHYRDWTSHPLQCRVLPSCCHQPWNRKVCEWWWCGLDCEIYLWHSSTLCLTVYKHNIVEGHRQLHLTIQYNLFPWIGFAKETVFSPSPPFFFLSWVSTEAKVSSTDVCRIEYLVVAD